MTPPLISALHNYYFLRELGGVGAGIQPVHLFRFSTMRHDGSRRESGQKNSEKQTLS